MEDIYSMFELGSVIKVFVSLCLGFAIGLERELAGKPAGMRTHMLIAMATTLFVILAMEMADVFSQTIDGSMLSVDPMKVIEAIMVGIAFMGAGTIIKDSKSGTVENLTTAASILVMGGIGVGVGLSMYAFAVIATLMVIFVNRSLLHVEMMINRSLGNNHH